MTDQHLPLAGFRIGVTAARKAEEQIGLLQRRGAEVVHAPALAADAGEVREAEVRAVTEDVLGEPVDILVATTGVGLKAWFAAAESWGLAEKLAAHLAEAEILARGPKTVGALRGYGLRELWAPESEQLDDVLAHLRGRDLTGKRIVLQEHGQSLSMAAHALRRQGAEVVVVTVYRVVGAPDLEPIFGLVEEIVARRVDAVTFTAAPAVVALMDAASSAGQRDAVVAAFQTDVVACCVGAVTAGAFDAWGVPSIHPERQRTAAMVKLLENELPSRAAGRTVEVAGHTLLVHGSDVWVDGVAVRLTPAPYAVLQALLAEPGVVVSRRELLAALPSGTAGSEHAVEMAVARLRAALGTKCVQTVVKRGYRLAVAQ